MARKLLAFIVSMMLIASFTGAAMAESTDTTALSGKLTIWAWGADSEAEARTAVIEAFIAAHPELDVEYSIIPTADSVWDQKASAALSTGSGPDIIQMSPDYYGMNTTYYADLNPYVERDSVDLSSVLLDGVIDGYYDADGKLEGFPLQTYCFCMAYNKDLFDAKGVAYPADGWTMQDLMDWGSAFVGGSGATQTYALVKHWVMNNIMLYAGGGMPYSSDLSECYMDSDNIKESLQLYADLINGGYIPNDTASNTIPAATLFESGLAAMYPLGAYEASSFLADCEENGINVGLCMMPSGLSDGKEITIQYATGWAMTTTCQNTDAAWAFLKESAYANEEMCKATCASGMTSCRAVAEDYYKNLTMAMVGSAFNTYMVEHIGASHLNPFGGTLASTGDIWSTMVQAVTLDNQTAEQAMETYAQQAMDEFASYGFHTSISAD